MSGPTVNIGDIFHHLGEMWTVRRFNSKKRTIILRASDGCDRILAEKEMSLDDLAALVRVERE